MLNIARRTIVQRAPSTLAPLLAIGARRTFLTIIEQGYVGMRLSLGRNPQELQPGLHLNIPVYHSVERIDMRERSLRISDLVSFTADNVPVTLDSSLFYTVVDPWRACFNVSNYGESLRNIGTSAVRAVVGTFQYDDIIGDRNRLNARLREVVGKEIAEWGVECSRCEIQKFEPSNAQVSRQLEMQMEAERMRRKQMLDTEAQVNVAEGMKRKTILESEGELQAQRNHAEGQYVRMVREAEARKAALELEAKALQAQVEDIAKAFNGDAEQAMRMLLELKRIEQFKAIAEGKNNSVYFARDPNMGNGYVADLAEKLKA